MKTEETVEWLKNQTITENGQKFYFHIIFWSSLRDEWVIRLQSKKGEDIIEFNQPTFIAALEQTVKAIRNPEEPKDELKGGPW
jgi:hypothetical protein